MSGQAKIPSFRSRMRQAGRSMLGVLSPKRYAMGQREQLRQMIDEVTVALTRYEGAGYSRINDWLMNDSASADAALLPELPRLRQRSRDLLRNNPIAIGIVNSLVTSVVGTGLRPQSRIDWRRAGIEKESAKEVQRTIEANFADHCETLDYEDRLDFSEIQELAFRQLLESGEYFAIRRFLSLGRRPRARYGTCWQLVEADCVMTPADKMGDPNIRSGIEFNALGQPVAYWVAKHHPGDIWALLQTKSTDFDRIPAYDREGRPQILHGFVKLRPNQSRGVPMLASIIELLIDTKQGFNNELGSLIASACLAFFITKEDPYDGTLSGPISAIADVNPDGTSTERQLERLQTGTIMRGKKGEDVKMLGGQRPAATFKDYLMFGIRLAGAAVQRPYEKITHDWSNTTYTSGRMSELDTWQVDDVHRKRLRKSLCQPVWEASIEEQMLRGDIPKIDDWSRTRRALCRSQWIGAGRRWVDPEKDAKAVKLMKALGLTTGTKEAAELGFDFEEMAETLLEEGLLDLEHRKILQDKAKELGLVLQEDDPAAFEEPDTETDGAGNGSYGSNGSDGKDTNKEPANAGDK